METHAAPALEAIAKEFGTPCYVYSREKIDTQCRALTGVFKGTGTVLCFAVKANSTRGVLSRVFSHGFGADTVSGGELHRALAAGADPARTVFSGVGKQDWEIELGLKHGIGAFNVESVSELNRIDRVAAAAGRTAPVLLRVNPNIDAGTNPYIATGLYATKFGIAETQLDEAIQVARSLPNLSLKGLGCHLGSQITDCAVFAQAAERMAGLAAPLKQGHPELQWLDLGGGLAVRYTGESPPRLEDYAQAVLAGAQKVGLVLVLEPGRWVVAEAGTLLTRVITLKQSPKKHFAVVDAAMNDLIRPSLYRATHPVRAVRPRAGIPQKTDVVGPICETGDFLALDTPLPPLEEGDLLEIGLCGAYAASMASNYNSRPRGPEVWLEAEITPRVLKVREPLEALSGLET